VAGDRSIIEAMNAMKNTLGIVFGAFLAVGLAVGSATAGVTNLPALSAHYDPIIRKIAARYAGVDPVLIHSIISVESAYDRFAVSDKGAQGLMQLMPDTAKDYGVKNVFNAWENIEGGIKYLSDLLKTYPNRLDLVLAAYNAGRSAVAKYDGVPPYPETREYVEKVTRVKSSLQPLAASGTRKTAIISYRDKDGKVRVTNIVTLIDTGSQQNPR
jgi:soluble lytic murein transglycosylase-like protein